MSSKVNVAVAAAFLVAAAAPVGAVAQSYGSAATVPGHQYYAQSKHPKVRVPVDAKASAADFNVSAAKKAGNANWRNTPIPNQSAQY